MLNEVLACGVPRSGSTLVWQVLCRALPCKVTKAHPASWQRRAVDYIVGSVRHPYDAAASAFRCRIINDDGDGSQETVKGTLKGLKADLRMLASNYKMMKELSQFFTDRVTVLKYENYFHSLDPIFDMVQDKFGINVPPKRRSSIRRECSFESNRRKVLKLNPGDKWVNRMGLSHVAVGYPGSWKAIMPVWGYATLRKWAEPICEEWGYAYSE